MSTVTADPRNPQRLSALERANEIRLARAELKQRIARGEVFPASVLLEPPEEARSWAIGDMLKSQRRWGSTRCRKFLTRNQINETKAVGALTERQRRLLAAGLAHPESELLAVGDQVLIVGRDHPWHGCRGVLITEFPDAPANGLRWRLRLECGVQCACTTAEIRKS